LVALAPAYAAYLERDAAGTPPGGLALPALAAPWTVDPTPSQWQPSFHNADITALRGFSNGASRVDLFISYYTRQDQDKKLVSFANRLAGDRGWDISNRSSTTVTIAGENVPVAVTQFAAPGRKRLVFSAYWVGGRFEANTLKAKLWQAKAQLIGGERAAAMVAMSSEITGDPAATAAALADFAAHLPPLRPVLEAASRR
jgi:EpsI family protein